MGSLIMIQVVLFMYQIVEKSVVKSWLLPQTSHGKAFYSQQNVPKTSFFIYLL